MLFIPPAPPPASLSTDAPAPTKNPFPFLHKPNTLDRDRIVVPAGWDSWGKIVVLRDGFEAKLWGGAWEKDLENEESLSEEPGAKRMYSALVPDQGLRVCFNLTLTHGRKVNVLFSRHCYHLSATRPRNKHSSRRTTTKTLKSPTKIHVSRSARQQKTRPLALSVH